MNTEKGESIIELKKYYEKRVRITDVNNVTFEGMVNDYFYPDDNISGKESIVIDTIDGRVIEFYQTDISRISIIED